MQVTKETITPKKAAEWLKRNVNNRPLSLRHCQSLAKTIERGEWVMNGETVKFNGNGDLLDGQHRLTAVVMSEKAIDTYVARQVPHEAFDTYDQGKVRRPSDMLARTGEANYKHLAVAIKLANELESGLNNDGTKLTNPQAAKYLEANPGIRESVAFCQAIGIRLIMSHGQAAALHYLMHKKSPATADSFWTQVANGEGLNKTMATYQLRQRFIENRAKVAKLPRRTTIALVIKAWNAFRLSAPVRVLKWSAESEEFPRIE